jgi:hypothetical protein
VRVGQQPLPELRKDTIEGTDSRAFCISNKTLSQINH